MTDEGEWGPEGPSEHEIQEMISELKDDAKQMGFTRCAVCGWPCVERCYDHQHAAVVEGEES